MRKNLAAWLFLALLTPGMAGAAEEATLVIETGVHEAAINAMALLPDLSIVSQFPSLSLSWRLCRKLQVQRPLLLLLLLLVL